MKRALLALATGLVLTASVSSQPSGGPGMMGGYWGPDGHAMGPGMMGGYGPGAYGPGFGWGPGMMGGYGPGYGMAPGMMGGYGPGRAMMPGYGPGGCDPSGPEFSSEQREKIAAIQAELAPKQWALMQKMQEFGWRSGNAYSGGKFDEQAARKSYDAMADLRKQMFALSLEAQKRIDALLTPQQREQMRRGGPGR